MYVGFVKSLLLVDARLFSIMALLSAVAEIFSDLVHKKRAIYRSLNSLVFQINTLIFPLILIFYVIIKASEAANFPNYVFSTFHLQPDNFLYLVIFSAALLFLNQIRNTLKIRNSLFERIKAFPRYIMDNPTENILKVFIFFFIFVYVSENLPDVLNRAVNSNLYVFTHINDSYDDKMRAKWRFLYDYTMFVKEYTEEDAKIVIPPKEAPWLETGNEGLMRSFFYPRKVVSGKYDALPEEDFDWVLINRGRWLVDDQTRYGWPKVYLEAEKIIYIDPLTREIEEIEKDFDPADVRNKDAWGLIKVRK
jgi:hypothetical protein